MRAFRRSGLFPERVVDGSPGSMGREPWSQGNAKALHRAMCGDTPPFIVCVEVVMGTRRPAAISDRRDDFLERHDAEINWMLDAIVGAIVAGRLPPDDACAWARIAAHEVEGLAMNVAIPAA
jgi:hypothetical protein